MSTEVQEETWQEMEKKSAALTEEAKVLADKALEKRRVEFIAEYDKLVNKFGLFLQAKFRRGYPALVLVQGRECSDIDVDWRS